MKTKTALIALFKTLAFTLVLAVLFPSVVKLSHAFTHHSHQVCDADGKLKTHFHQSDLDACFISDGDLDLFLVFNNYEIIPQKTANKQLTSYYISLNNYQQLSRFVRGPPQVS